MNFVADESCAMPLNFTHCVKRVTTCRAEVAKGATDDQALGQALDAKRVLITEDRDFDELVTHVDVRLLT